MVKEVGGAPQAAPVEPGRPFLLAQRAAAFSGAGQGSDQGISFVSGATKAPGRVQLPASINGNLKSAHQLRCRLSKYLSLTLAKHILMRVWSHKREVYVQFYLVRFTNSQHKPGWEGCAEQLAQSLWKVLYLFCACGV